MGRKKLFSLLYYHLIHIHSRWRTTKSAKSCSWAESAKSCSWAVCDHLSRIIFVPIQCTRLSEI